MAIVKGTKVHPVRVVQYRPWIQAFYFFIFLVAALAFAAYCFYMGHSKGMKGQEEALASVSRLEQSLGISQAKADELGQQLENLKLGTKIDEQANENVRQEVLSLKDEIAKLQEENSFYRGLMAPTKNKRGLTFGVVELTTSNENRVYNFKVVMQQLATNHQLLKGSLQYIITGRTNGIEMKYRLHELSDQVSDAEVRLRFKYFQTIEGKIRLPEGFEPERIDLVAKSTGKNPVTVEKRFGWLVEEV